MKYYVATSYANKVGANLLMDFISKSRNPNLKGLVPTCNWVWEPPVEDTPDAWAKRTMTDLDCIDEADFVISLNPYGYGTASEQGYAVGKGKPLIILMDQYDEDRSFIGCLHGARDVHVVHHLAELVDTIESIVLRAI